MILKNKKFMIGTIAGILSVGTSLAIALPLSLSIKDEADPMWNQPLPTVFYKAKVGGPNAYTTNKVDAQGYVVGVNPEAAIITPPTEYGRSITIDENVVYAREVLFFDKKIPEKTFYKLKNDGSLEYTTDKTKAHDYKEATIEVKPKIKETTIMNAHGGDVYNENNWTWEKTKQRASRRDEIKPTINGVTIKSSNGGDQYAQDKWIWHPQKPSVEKILFYGIDLEKKDLKFTDDGTIAEKVAILDCLNRLKKISFRHIPSDDDTSDDIVLKFLNTSLEGRIKGKKWQKNGNNSYERILDTDELKAWAFNLIDSKIKTRKQSKGQNKKMFRKIMKTQSWVPFYNGTKITDNRFTSSSKLDDGSPPPEFVPSDYNAGQEARDVKKDEYTPSYKGTPLAEFTQEVTYIGVSKGSAPIGAPTTFVETDFDSGIAGQTTNEPAKVDIIALRTLTDQDKIKIDETTYTVNKKFVYQIKPGKFASQTTLYQKGANFVTDITRADGYVKEVIPQSATITPKVGTTITINGRTYIFK